MEMFMLYYWVGCVISLVIGLVYCLLIEMFGRSTIHRTEDKLYFYLKGICLYTILSWMGVLVFIYSIYRFYNRVVTKS